VIPTGSGLGGGSSDAAETLHLINRFLDLKISSGQLVAMAAKLGADCPFFMQRTPCYATGKGELLEPVKLDISNYSLLLVHPEVRIQTAWAFSLITPAIPTYDLKESISKPVKEWIHTISNDFEPPVFKAYPQLQIIKDRLYDTGAIYASMTGSGSTIYGIFEKSAVPEISFEHATQTIIR